MRSLTLAAFFAALFCFQVSVCDQAAAQVVRKSGGDPVVKYQPSDPWKRGRIFNIQTGNSGLFYNCDGEQAKRCSPYICWKRDDEPMLPPLFEPVKMWKEQLDTVRQRVSDGSCRDLGCSCADCRKARRNGQMGGCAACRQAAARHPRLSKTATAKSSDVESAVVKTALTQPEVVKSGHGTKYGLVQGKIVEPKTPHQIEAPVLPTSKQSSVAKRSLLDQLRGTKKR